MAESAAKKSTIVRTPFSPRQRAVRAAFGILERRAPRLGSLWAERLWFTIPRDRRPRPALTEPGAIVTLALREDQGAKSPTFVAEVWGSSGPVVYLLHGWGGYRGQLGAFVAPLTAAGYRVVALDAPSHGDSGPGSFGAGRSLITEFTAALTAVTRAFGPAHGIVAHSLGAGATALAVLEGLPARRLVLIAPAPDPGAFAVLFAAGLGFGDRIRSGLMRRLERRVGRPMSEFDAVAHARAAAEARSGSGDEDAVMPPPLLVVHDRRDNVIPYSQGTAIAAAWQGAELLSTAGLGHHRILRDPETVRSAVDFLGSATVSASGSAAAPGSRTVAR
jgi:pimeloyl-ACP methyl ester carboxylesterase